MAILATRVLGVYKVTLVLRGPLALWVFKVYRVILEFMGLLVTQEIRGFRVYKVIQEQLDIPVEMV